MAEEIPTETLSETENYSVWVSQEPDGEVTYHVEIGTVTLHFFDEEWEEFVELMKALPADKSENKRPTKR